MTPGCGIGIDLHWRLFRNRWLPANARIEEVGEAWVDVGSERIPGLPASRLLLYLCMHGALDGWLRLKWLADIGALLHTMTPEQLRLTAAAAAEQQALPQFSAALILCQDMLGPHPAPAECLDRNDERVAHILRFSKRLMTSNHYCPVREKIPATQWFLNEFSLHTSLRYRLDLVLRSLFRPRVWHTFHLPDALFPLYALLSPLEWFDFPYAPSPCAPETNAAGPRTSPRAVHTSACAPHHANDACRYCPDRGSWVHAYLLPHCPQLSARAAAHCMDGQS